MQPWNLKCLAALPGVRAILLSKHKFADRLTKVSVSVHQWSKSLFPARSSVRMALRISRPSFGQAATSSASSRQRRSASGEAIEQGCGLPMPHVFSLATGCKSRPEIRVLGHQHSPDWASAGRPKARSGGSPASIANSRAWPASFCVAAINPPPYFGEKVSAG
jgi:hypothetical protein